MHKEDKKNLISPLPEKNFFVFFLVQKILQESNPRCLAICEFCYSKKAHFNELYRYSK